MTKDRESTTVIIKSRGPVLSTREDEKATSTPGLNWVFIDHQRGGIMDLDEIDQKLASLDPSKLKLLARKLSETPKVKKVEEPKFKIMVTYSYTCLFCQNKWEVEDFAISNRNQRTEVKRDVLWCHKCSLRLMEIPKDTIITRAISIISKGPRVVREEILHAEDNYNKIPIFRDWPPRKGGDLDEDNEAQNESSHEDGESSPTNDSEVGTLPTEEELEIPEGEVGRDTQLDHYKQFQAYTAAALDELEEETKGGREDE